jgi:GTPase SAR1 family protein
MEKRPYKLAIMGASGVGKTVFLGSYFYANEKGMGKKYHVAPLLEKTAAASDKAEQELNSVQVVNELIGSLFKGSQIGTHKRLDMSMTVGDKMKVRLFDLPGGFTVDSTRWEDQKIKEDLETADGVIFFIPAWDTLHNYMECRKASTPFSTAISQFIRNEKEDAKERKADIPIYFLFTKADMLQGSEKDITAEELLEHWKGLKASSQTGSERTFFKKGQFDKSFMVTSLGTWLDENTPPTEEKYRPVNVVESMESLFDAMVQARRNRDRNSHLKKTALTTVTALAVFAAVLGTGYTVQKIRWNSAEKAMQLAVSRGNYPEAITALDNFRAHRSLLGFSLPAFMSPGKDVDAQIDKLRFDYEADSYKELAGYIQIAETTELPNSESDSFKQGAQAVKNYLTNDTFAAIAPAHYAAVKKAEQYYAAGNIMSGTVKSLNDIQVILTQIDVVPENWREPLLKRIPAGVAVWRVALDEAAAAQEAETPGTGLQEYDTALSQLRALTSTLPMSDQIKEALKEQIDGIEQSKSTMMDQFISTKIAEANRFANPEEAIALMEDLKLAHQLSDAQKDRIQSAADKHYEALVSRWIDEKTDIEKLRGYLRQYPTMPESAKSLADSYIQRVAATQKEALRQSILSAKNMSILLDKSKEANKNYSGQQEFRTAIAQRFQELLIRNTQNADDDIQESLGSNDFRNAKMIITNFSNEVNSNSVKISAFCDAGAATNSMAEWKEQWLSNASSQNYRYLRTKFNSYGDSCSSAELRDFSQELKDFTILWPQAPQDNEILQVIHYVSSIRNGVNARLTVERAKVNIGTNTTFGSNLMIKVMAGSTTFATDNHNFNNDPEFNEDFDFKWSIDMAPVVMKFTNVNWILENKELPEQISVPCDGITGWKKLNGPHATPNKNIMVWLKVDGIPNCPW